MAIHTIKTLKLSQETLGIFPHYNTLFHFQLFTYLCLNGNLSTYLVIWRIPLPSCAGGCIKMCSMQIGTFSYFHFPIFLFCKCSANTYNNCQISHKSFFEVNTRQIWLITSKLQLSCAYIEFLGIESLELNMYKGRFIFFEIIHVRPTKFLFRFSFNNCCSQPFQLQVPPTDI